MNHIKKLLSTVFAFSMCMIYMTVSAFAVCRPKADDADVTAENLYVSTGNTEADTVFNNFVDAMIQMKNSDDHSKRGVLDIYNLLLADGKQAISIDIRFKEVCNATPGQSEAKGTTVVTTAKEENHSTTIAIVPGALGVLVIGFAAFFIGKKRKSK